MPILTYSNLIIIKFVNFIKGTFVQNTCRFLQTTINEVDPLDENIFGFSLFVKVVKVYWKEVHLFTTHSKNNLKIKN